MNNKNISKLLLSFGILLFVSCQNSVQEQKNKKSVENGSPVTSRVKINNYNFIRDSFYYDPYKISWKEKKEIFRSLLTYSDSTNPSFAKTVYYSSDTGSKCPCFQIYFGRHTKHTLCTEALFLINLILFEKFDGFSPYPSFKKEYLDSTKDDLHPQKVVIERYKKWFEQVVSKELNEKEAKSELMPMGNFWLNCYSNWDTRERRKNN